MREIRYRAIAADLRRDLGAATPGSLLPSEAELSQRYGVSRVTVRKALEVLREEGLIDSRQGFGWFAAVAPVRQDLGHLGTIEAQMAAQGRQPGRKVLEFAWQEAPAPVAELLGPGSVLRVRRLNLADGAPFALVTVWAPERLAGSLSRDDVERSPFYELIGVGLASATQTIGAAAASAADARALGVPVGSPVLVCQRVTRSQDGEVVLVSEHVFPAHRTEFVVELVSPEPSIAPSGLRLLE
ncbi:MAG TPA: GntR family transcriptional regulator [Acidimicrobiales bacterium]|nr:GntR family transcriptional regulator [Acidimicrobiales bacterium]